MGKGFSKKEKEQCKSVLMTLTSYTMVPMSSIVQRAQACISPDVTEEEVWTAILESLSIEENSLPNNDGSFEGEIINNGVRELSFFVDKSENVWNVEVIMDCVLTIYAIIIINRTKN